MAEPWHFPLRKKAGKSRKGLKILRWFVKEWSVILKSCSGFFEVKITKKLYTTRR